MADAFLTLADLIKVNDMNLADLQVTDLLDDAPLLKALAAEVASNGTEHKYLKETGAPTVGFRAVNDGTENSKSTDTLVTITLKILAASFGVDKALADAYRYGPDAYIAREARRQLKAAFFMAEKQLINGTDNDADGFTGLVDASTIDAVADAMVVNAGGTTADVQSSVYLIRTNDMGNDVTAITGNDGLIAIGDTVVNKATGSATGTYPEYYTPVEGWLGLQIGSAQSVARICNLSATDSKPLTDDLIFEALSLFPAGRKPNLAVMNGTRLEELRQSRTATNATGAPAPVPDTVGPCRIIETDAILNTEALVA